MVSTMDDIRLVVIGAAAGTEVALGKLFALLPLPMAAAVVVAVQGAAPDDVVRVLQLGPPELRLLWRPQPLGNGGLWLVPPGYEVRIEGDCLVPRPAGRRGAPMVLAPLFASAAPHAVLGVLLGDTGLDGEAAAAAFGSCPLLRPDPDQLPRLGRFLPGG